MAEDCDVITYSQFACIGAGFSAIGLGATLQRWHGITDLRIFERNDELGGTWYSNKYPGCACDIPSALYSFSFAANPSWSRVLAPQKELLQYLLDVANEYNLVPRMTFGVNVDSATWIEDRSRWRIVFRPNGSDRLYYHESQFLFAGTGQLLTPRELDVPGIETFKGPVMHSARWREDVSLRQQRVVVFGNGCTAAQIVPSIVAQTRHLTQIVRSKHWILPPVDVKVPAWVRYILTHVPGLMGLFRLLVFLGAENSLRGFPLTKAGARFRARSRRKAERYMRSTAPAKYHDMLIPDFEIGCKRRIFDSGYLQSLHAENLTLVNSKAIEILPDGVKTADGFIEADVLVLANGFKTNHFVDKVKVTGRNGVTLAEHWERFGGAEAYNTSVMSGFPNFFILIGPNAVTGHTSTIMAAENSINYALRIIRPILDGHARAADLKPNAEKQYVDGIQSALKKTVWFSGCASWYVRGVAGEKVWNAMTYPWSQAHFWYRSLFPVWADWQYTGSGVQRRRRTSSWGKVAMLAYAAYIIMLILKAKNRSAGSMRIWSALLRWVTSVQALTKSLARR